MFGLPFQFDCLRDGLAAQMIWAWVGSARVEAASGKKNCFENRESISKWRSVWESRTVFSNAWALGSHTAQCFWDWACIGAGQIKRGTWKRIN